MATRISRSHACFAHPRRWVAVLMSAVLMLAALVALAPGAPASALAADYETAATDDLTVQAAGLSISPTVVEFNLYPGYTQGQSVRAITVKNNTGKTVTGIHFANFKGTKAATTEGAQDYVPYVVTDESGANYLSDVFVEGADGASIEWVDWAKENGYTTLESGQTRTYYLALERDAWWPCMANGTDVTDTVDLACSSGTTTITLHTRVYEPAAGIVTAQIGTKADATSPDVSPVSSITLAETAAGADSPAATLFGLKNTSTKNDPVTGQKPSLVLRRAAIEDDAAGIFKLIGYQGTRGTEIDGQTNLNQSIGPDATSTLGVAVDASFVPAGTYKANVCLYVSPSTITFNSGVKKGAPDSEGYTRVTIPVSVTVTGSNPNLRPAPGNLKAAGYNGAVVLSWDAVAPNDEGYDGYVVWRFGGGDDVIEYVDAANTQYVDRDVANGTTYTYYVGCQNGGEDAQLALCPRSGPVKATPSASAPQKLDQPFIDVNLDELPEAVGAKWYLQDFSDNGAGLVDHFNVYLNKKLVATVKQSAVQTKGSDCYWTCTVPVKVPYQQYYVNVAAVAADGTEGLWSETAFGCASSSTPIIESVNLTWDYEAGTITASANVWCDGELAVSTRIDRDGTQVATVDGGESFVDGGVQAGATYAYTFTATTSNGKTSEPYKASIYADPGDYATGESDMVPVTVAPAEGDDETAVSISIDTKPSAIYVVKRDGDDAAAIAGVGETVRLVDHPGTGVHEYRVEKHAADGSVVATSLTRAVEIVADAQPGQMEIVAGGVASQPMYRLYNPWSGEHFYTADPAERDSVEAAGWTYEGVGWDAPLMGDAVYRVYNSYAGEHHYTLKADERDELIAAGWTDEGTGWFSDPNEAVPLYREYNPNMFSCNHNYTTDWEEHDGLVALGWQDEGYAWYGV